MPAIERSFQDPLPERFYLDTDFLIAGLIDAEPHHIQARALLDGSGETGVVLSLSLLSWIEFVNVVIKERFWTRLPDEVQRRYQLRYWQRVGVRRVYIGSMLSAFDDALAQFAWDEVTLTPDIRRQALEHVAQHGLRPHDAVHLASAFAARCSDLASFDEGFHQVDGLTLWNDVFHTDGPTRG